MKEFFDITILSALQGVAEFLPISSSGHLVIAKDFLGMKDAGIRLDIFLHLGTLVSIFVFYRSKISAVLGGILAGGRDAGRCREAWRYAGKIVLSAVPAIALYLVSKIAFHTSLEDLPVFRESRMVGALLMFTGTVLLGTRFLPQGRTPVGTLQAVLMGCAQAISLLPGVSRSGMTLAASRAGHVASEDAAEFSFLMSAPLIAGAALLQIKDALEMTGSAIEEPSWGLVVYGAVLASVIGYFSLALLVRTLRGKWFWLFGPYCLTAGALLVFFR